MRKYYKLGSIRRLLPIALSGILIVVLVAGCCPAIRVGSGGKLVPSGAIDENGNPVPAGAKCTSGKTCLNTEKYCGLFAYKENSKCTNVWNSVTGECTCKCSTI